MSPPLTSPPLLHFRQSRLWFSGHFHIDHNFPDSISHVNKCTFVQCGVIGKKSARSAARQTRILDLDLDEGKAMIYSVDHHLEGKLRLDAECDLTSGVLMSSHSISSSNESPSKEQFQRTYVPQQEDGCYSKFGSEAVLANPEDMVCWWHMADGRVLGTHDGMLLEYDSVTLAPLGIVLESQDLKNKEIRVVNDGNVLITIDKEKNDVDSLKVVQPNADGSYWRRFQRNKKQRLDEKKRLEIAKEYISSFD